MENKLKASTRVQNGPMRVHFSIEGTYNININRLSVPLYPLYPPIFLAWRDFSLSFSVNKKRGEISILGMYCFKRVQRVQKVFLWLSILIAKKMLYPLRAILYPHASDDSENERKMCVANDAGFTGCTLYIARWRFYTGCGR
jgi:hypothetical protein